MKTTILLFSLLFALLLFVFAATQEEVSQTLENFVQGEAQIQNAPSAELLDANDHSLMQTLSVGEEETMEASEMDLEETL